MPQSDTRASRGNPQVSASVNPVGGIANADLNRLVGAEKTTFGWVRAFTVDNERMLIKLDCSAIFRVLVSISADRPNFRTSVSLTMMAYNNKEQLSVRYVEVNRPQPGPELVHGIEVGLGDKAFEIESWPYSPMS